MIGYIIVREVRLRPGTVCHYGRPKGPKGYINSKGYITPKGQTHTGNGINTAKIKRYIEFKRGLTRKTMSKTQNGLNSREGQTYT